MNISRDNYESWFLDYLDGKLNEGELEGLASFLEFNPDLAQELEELDLVRLEVDDTKYDLKFTLKKPGTTRDHQEILDHFEEYCLLGIEQQLDSREEKMLQDILQNEPSRRRTYNLYRSTLLVPEQKILYPRKSRLRKSILLIPRVRIAVSSAAAAVLVFLGLSLLIRNHPVSVSENTSPPATMKVEANDAIVAGEVHGSHGPTGERITEKANKPETGIPAKPVQPGSEVTMPIRESLVVNRMESRGFEPLEYPAKPGGFLPVDDFPSRRTFLTSAPQQPELKNALWALADAGIQRISDKSEEYFSLERETGRDGITRRLTFETQWFGISAPVRFADGRK